jgi:periodic tryptophan protein 2
MVPGAKTPKNLIQRKTRLAVRVKCIKFSPDGSQFAVASTEGLLLYSNKIANDKNALFNPLYIDETVTLENIIHKVKKDEHLTALVLALRLNEAEITQTVFKCIPQGSIELIVAHFPKNFLPKLLSLLAAEMQAGRSIEWTNIWLKNVLKYQADALDGSKGENRSALLLLC